MDWPPAKGPPPPPPWGPALGRGEIPKRHYKAPTDYTKPQKIIQRIKILDKRTKLLDRYLKCLTRVATNINLT